MNRLLLLLFLAQTPAAVNISDPTYQSRKVTTTTSGLKVLLDVNCPGCTGGSGSSIVWVDGGRLTVDQGGSRDGGTDWSTVSRLWDGTTYVTVEPNGALDVDIDQITGTVVTGNSTATLLGIGGVFTGTSTDLLNAAAISLSCFSDVASAAGGLALQWSSNGTNWDITEVYTTVAGLGFHVNDNVRARYFRVVYTNGGTGQGAFRLQTISLPVSPTDAKKAIQAVPVANDPAALVQAVIYGATTAGGGSYVAVKTNPSGALSVAATQDTSPWVVSGAVTATVSGSVFAAIDAGSSISAVQSGVWNVNFDAGTTTTTYQGGVWSMFAAIDAGSSISAVQSGVWNINIDAGTTVTAYPGGAWSVFAATDAGSSISAVQSGVWNVNTDAGTQVTVFQSPAAWTVTGSVFAATDAGSSISAVQSGVWNVNFDAGTTTTTYQGGVWSVFAATDAGSSISAVQSGVWNINIDAGTTVTAYPGGAWSVFAATDAGSSISAVQSGVWNVNTDAGTQVTVFQSPAAWTVTGSVFAAIDAGSSISAVQSGVWNVNFDAGTTVTVYPGGAWSVFAAIDAGSSISAVQSGVWNVNTDAGTAVTVYQSLAAWSVVLDAGSTLTSYQGGVWSVNIDAGTTVTAYPGGVWSVNFDAGTTTTTYQGGAWTVQPGNTANTTPWLTTDTPRTVASANNAGTCTSVGIASTTVLSSNASRRTWGMKASEANAVTAFCKLGATATTANMSFGAGSAFYQDTGAVYTGVVDCITASSTANVCVFELQ